MSKIPFHPLQVQTVCAFIFNTQYGPDSLSCDMVLLRYVFISLSFEKDLSAIERITGRVRNSLIV